MALVAGSAASGQALKPYRLHVLKDSAGADFVVHNIELRLVPNGMGGTASISDQGVVGGSFETGTSTFLYRGFVWFPNDLGLGSSFQFPVLEVLDIHDYGVSLGQGESTFVNDVADSRALVGFRGDASTLAGDAYIFPLDLTAGSIGAASLHTTTGDYSMAFGVRDSTPIAIVGQTSIACVAPSQYLRPFTTTWSSGGGAGTMALLGLPADAGSGLASEISRSGSSAWVSGEAEACEQDTDDCTVNLCEILCPREEFLALRWLGGSAPTVLDGLDMMVSYASGAGGRGVNPSGDACGWGHFDVTNCPRRAGFWRAGSSASHVPGDTMPFGQPVSEGSWGEAISPRTVDGCVSIVGMNLETQAALIWHGFDDDWCAYDLNEITLPCALGYQLRRAMDINRHRHITVLVVGPSGSRHLGVLTSAADFDGNLRVDLDDRQALFINLCTSCSAAQLEFDLNCDGSVTSADMALLVGTYWSGSTKLAVVPTVCECEQEQQSMSSGLLDESTALAALGFANWDEFTAWVGTADPVQADNACDMLAELLRGDAE